MTVYVIMTKMIGLTIKMALILLRLAKDVGYEDHNDDDSDADITETP